MSLKNMEMGMAGGRGGRNSGVGGTFLRVWVGEAAHCGDAVMYFPAPSSGRRCLLPAAGVTHYRKLSDASSQWGLPQLQRAGLSKIMPLHKSSPYPVQDRWGGIETCTPCLKLGQFRRLIPYSNLL